MAVIKKVLKGLLPLVGYGADARGLGQKIGRWRSGANYPAKRLKWQAGGRP